MIQEKYGFRGYMDIKNTEKRNDKGKVLKARIEKKRHTTCRNIKIRMKRFFV